MYPHGRLLLAALTFSGVLGLLVALAGFGAGYWLASQPPTDPPDNAPIRAVVVLIYFIAPAVALASLVLSLPASYLQWRKPIPFPFVASISAFLAIVAVSFLFLPDSSIGATVIAAVVFAAMAIVAARCWQAAFPHSNKSLERTREE